MSEWITDPNNLPENRKRVLVCFDHKVYGEEVYMRRDVAVGERYYGEWYVYGFVGARVKAWMPLPKMPEIKEEET